MPKSKKMQLKAWYNELNDRLKSDLKRRFEEDFELGEQGFYSLFKAKALSVDRAILFADFFSKHVMECQVHDLYFTPEEVIKQAKKKWVTDEPNVAFNKTLSMLDKHGLVAGQ